MIDKDNLIIVARRKLSDRNWQFGWVVIDVFEFPSLDDSQYLLLKVGLK